MQSRGFTLVELMIVMIIMGILVVVGVGNFTSSQKKSRDTKRKNDIRQVALSLEAYVNDKGSYPRGDGLGNILGCVPDGVTACTWGQIFQADTNGAVYMISLPLESKGNRRYMYVSTDGSYYQLYTRLENTLDSDIPRDAQDKARVFSDLDCSSDGSNAYCNYAVASQNKTAEDGRSVSYE